MSLLTLLLVAFAGMLLGGVLVCTGYAVGYRSRSNALPPAPRPALNVIPMGECGCEHAQSFHLDGKGRCRKEWYVKEAEDWYTCDCMIYVPKNAPSTPLLEAMKELEGY